MGDSLREGTRGTAFQNNNYLANELILQKNPKNIFKGNDDIFRDDPEAARRLLYLFRLSTRCDSC
jgi:uncharacterized protein (DUF924 family)